MSVPQLLTKRLIATNSLTDRVVASTQRNSDGQGFNLYPQGQADYSDFALTGAGLRSRTKTFYVGVHLGLGPVRRQKHADVAAATADSGVLYQEIKQPDLVSVCQPLTAWDRYVGHR
jgi:hypothetical protein